MRCINQYRFLLINALVSCVFAVNIFAGQPSKETVEFTVGDPSGSHSEIWRLNVGSFGFTSPGYGVSDSKSFDFDLGKSYPITITHVKSNRDDPDYDWQGLVNGAPSSKVRCRNTFLIPPRIEVDNQNGLLGKCDQSCYQPDYTAGKRATMRIFDFDSLNFSTKKLEVGKKCTATAVLKPEKRPWKWKITRKPKDTTYEVKDDKLIITAGCETGKVSVMVYMAALPNVKTNASFDVVGCGASCNPFGGSSGGLGSINYQFSVGAGAWGESIGTIDLHAEKPCPALCHPCALSFDVVRDDIEIIHEYGYLRQIRTPQGLVDIIPTTNYYYTIDYYGAGLVAGTNSSGYYTLKPGSEPFVSYLIENPERSLDSYNTLEISQIRGASTQKTVYAWNDENSVWTMNKGEDSVSEELIKEWTTEGNNKQYTTYHNTLDAQSNVIYTVKEVYKQYTWTQELISRTIDPDGLALTTSNAYCDNVISYYDERNYTDVIMGTNGLLKHAVLPDGSWKKYAYNSDGLETSRTAPWKNARLLDTTAPVKQYVSSYESIDVRDTRVDRSNAVRTASTYINNILVGRTYNAYFTDTEGRMVEISEQAVEQVSAYGDTGNQRTIQYSYNYDETNGIFAGRVQRIEYPDGRLDVYRYDFGTLQTNSDPAQISFSPGSTGMWLRVMVDHVTIDNPNGIAGKSTRDVTLSDYLDNNVLQEVYVYDGSGYNDRIEWTYNEYDFLNRLKKLHKSTGLITETGWSGFGCCGKDNETDAFGIETVYTYDDVTGNMLSEGKINTNDMVTLVHEYTYDRLGNMLTERITDGSESLVSSNRYDAAKRLVERYDVAGIKTEYRYEQGGRVTRTIRAGLTNETANYIDGRTKYIKENGICKSFYDYGVNADGSQWMIVYSGLEGGNSPIWEKTVTDMSGNTIRQEKPGYKGELSETPLLVTEMFYNNIGQLTNQQSYTYADGQVENVNSVLYEYDDFGRQYRTCQDINLNGQIDLAGPDRVTDSLVCFREIGNDWWQTSETVSYTRDGSAVPLTNSISRTRLTSLGNAVAGKGTRTEERVNYDTFGNETIETTYIDRDNKQTLRLQEIAASLLPGESLTVNGLLLKTVSLTGTTNRYQYDGLERQIAIEQYTQQGLSNRLVATYTHYNSSNQVDWIEDAAGNRTEYIYDEYGRRTAVTDALTNTIYTAYDVYGRTLAQWGATYPVAYEYDDYGRMIAMLTTRDNSLTITGCSSFTLYASSFERTAWQYDDTTGLLTNKVYANGNGTAYTYTPDGQLASRNWARGIVTEYTYDTIGQLTNVHYSDSTPGIGYAYNRAGQQVKITDVLGTRTNVYNAYGQLTVEKRPDGTTLDRSYDVLGRSDGIALDSGYSLGYSYDDMGRFSTISSSVDSVTSVVNYYYLQNSTLLSGYIIANPVSSIQYQVSRTYEPYRDLITSIRNSFNANLISQFNYINDAVGRRIERIDTSVHSVQTNVFGYNMRSELIDAAMNTNDYQYEYDPIGNRMEVSFNAITNYYAANDLNQYTNILEGGAPATPLFYDADGNLTNDSVFRYIWNAENRLASIKPLQMQYGDENIYFSYDSMGRCVKKDIYTYLPGVGYGWQLEHHYFTYDNWNLIKKDIEFDVSANPLNKTNSTDQYAWGIDLSGSLQGAGGVGGLLGVIHSSSSLIYHPCYDANGNITDYVTTNGTIAAHYEYDPYGNIIYTNGSNADDFAFRFSTKYFDVDSGLYYYGYRYYNPEMGRWINRDPVGEQGGINLFGFVQNMPINDVDALGLKHGNPVPPGAISPAPPAPWTAADAFTRYFAGTGGSVSLQSIGLYDTVTAALQPLMDAWKEQAIESIEAAASILSCPSPTLTSTMQADTTGADSGVFWIGGIAFSRNYVCQAEADCSSCSYTYTCNMSYSMNDAFTDPWDLGNWFPGEWDPGGTPFNVTGSWSDSITDTKKL